MCPANIGGQNVEKSRYHNNMDAVLYHQHSAEYIGLCHQAFNLALLRIEAGSMQQGDSVHITSDLDETLLDNSAYQAWMLKTGRDFHEDSWDHWCEARDAKALPGAVEFITEMRNKGVKVYFVSSRSNVTRAATIDNLEGLKLLTPEQAALERRLVSDAPPEEGEKGPQVCVESTCLFLKGLEIKKEKLQEIAPDGNWESLSSRTRKTAQYTLIDDREGRKPAVRLGDNLSDFSEKKYNKKLSKEQRNKNSKADSSRWGSDWIVFPNPTYGNWKLVLGAKSEIPQEYWSRHPEIEEGLANGGKEYEKQLAGCGALARPAIPAAESPKAGLLNGWNGKDQCGNECKSLPGYP